MRGLILVAVAPLALAACGGGDDDGASGVASLDEPAATSDAADEPGEPDDAADAPTTEETEVQMLEFAQCMRDEGIEIGDPVVDADGNVTFGGLGPGGAGGESAGRPDPASFEACGDLLDGLQLGRGGGADRTELEDSLLEFAQCMRDEGIDMADPDFSSADRGSGGGPFGELDQSDPAVEAATEACGDLLAGRGPGGRAGGA